MAASGDVESAFERVKPSLELAAEKAQTVLREPILRRGERSPERGIGPRPGRAPARCRRSRDRSLAMAGPSGRVVGTFVCGVRP